jgi:hypothetical protein
MHWFRDHIRRGSWIALLALAINLGLSFGHVHAIVGGDFPNRPSSQVAAIGSPDNGSTGDRHGGDRADLLCSICMAAHAMGQALGSAPPALPLALAESPVDLTTEPDLAVLQPPRAAFDSRGPPTS